MVIVSIKTENNKCCCSKIWVRLRAVGANKQPAPSFDATGWRLGSASLRSEVFDRLLQLHRPGLCILRSACMRCLLSLCRCVVTHYQHLTYLDILAFCVRFHEKSQRKYCLTRERKKQNTTKSKSEKREWRLFYRAG